MALEPSGLIASHLTLRSLIARLRERPDITNANWLFTPDGWEETEIKQRRLIVNVLLDLVRREKLGRASAAVLVGYLALDHEEEAYAVDAVVSILGAQFAVSMLDAPTPRDRDHPRSRSLAVAAARHPAVFPIAPAGVLIGLIEACQSQSDPPELSLTCLDVARYDRADVLQGCLDLHGAEAILGLDPGSSPIALAVWARRLVPVPVACRHLLAELGVPRVAVAISVCRSAPVDPGLQVAAIADISELNRSAALEGDERTLLVIREFARSEAWLASMYRTAAYK